MRLSAILPFANLVASKHVNDGNKVIRFKSITGTELELLAIFNEIDTIDIWSHEDFGQIQPGMQVDMRLSPALYHIVQQQFGRKSFDVLIEDYQLAVELQKEQTESKDDYNLREYHTYEDMKAWIQSFSGDNIKQVTYGTSYEGRDLYAIEIGTGSRYISIDCGIHAREWISPAYCQWFINEAINGQFVQYTTDFTFLVQPMINPDGYAYTWTNDRMWRKTRKPNDDSPCIGTDLNRNYDSNWGGQGASPLPCSETFRGPTVFSAEESAAQRDYLKDYASGLELFLTFHSYSQYILYPYSWNNPAGHPNKDELESVGASMADAIQGVHNKKYTMGETISIFYPASGGSDDWGYDIQREANNPNPLSYTYELRDNGRYGFLLPPDQIEPNCEEVDAAMHVAFNHLLNRK